MVERTDPARTGVKAGRVVGLLTAVFAVISLIRVQGSYYENVATVFTLLGIESQFSVTVLFWGNVLLTASARYVIGYVVGSLIGVLYDWLDRPSLLILIGIVFVVGAVDGLLAAIDTRSIGIGCAYAIAWLCYVPVFAWLFEDDAGTVEKGPLRLGDL
ncbi:hypothetical protein [Natrinema salsiterrestre]|uniref:Uncharacterized protein n=1 Tax=Natrinema salsiterrestre TaxID=2950540 RepID=A0A9Q4L4L6_9EURY|nr:hypothetical protein [Natrinema salsiterrestre]MDF9748236.1 hypothetical protein [Natrinema salsiterrestre]